MLINTKCNKCNESTKFVTGFWDGEGDTHGCLYDCKNTKCDVKQLREVADQEAVQKRLEIQRLNGKNGIYAGQLVALRKNAKVSIRKMAEISGCNVGRILRLRKRTKSI